MVSSAAILLCSSASSVIVLDNGTELDTWRHVGMQASSECAVSLRQDGSVGHVRLST